MTLSRLLFTMQLKGDPRECGSRTATEEDEWSDTSGRHSVLSSQGIKAGRDDGVGIRQDPEAAARMSEILLAGVSTRRYATVLPKMAKTVEVSRSQLS